MSYDRMSCDKCLKCYLFKKFEFENIKIRFRLDVAGNYSSLYLL